MIPPSETLLSGTPLFRGLAAEERQRIEREPVLRRFAPGEIILHVGDYGQVMFVVAEGAVQVFSRGHAGQDVVLARLERGDAFGGQALISGTARRSGGG